MTCPIHPTRGYGCRHCDLTARRASRERRYTRAELLAFGERVREACAASMLENPKAMFRAVRAVDVARLLEETKE